MYNNSDSNGEDIIDDSDYQKGDIEDEGNVIKCDKISDKIM